MSFGGNFDASNKVFVLLVAFQWNPPFIFLRKFVNGEHTLLCDYALIVELRFDD
jgi:hypothetical protein